MTSLALPPSHPKFPSSPVLHAICAVGSLYTAAVTSPPFPDYGKVDPGALTVNGGHCCRAFIQRRYSLKDIELKKIGRIHLPSSKPSVLEIRLSS